MERSRDDAEGLTSMAHLRGNAPTASAPLGTIKKSPSLRLSLLADAISLSCCTHSSSPFPIASSRTAAGKPPTLHFYCRPPRNPGLQFFGGSTFLSRVVIFDPSALCLPWAVPVVKQCQYLILWAPCECDQHFVCYWVDRDTLPCKAQHPECRL